MEEIDIEVVYQGIMFGKKDKRKVKRSERVKEQPLAKAKESVIVKNFTLNQQSQSLLDEE